MFKTNSAIVISRNSLDNFINRKILEKYGVTDIVTFESTVQALLYLQKTQIYYQVILVDICMPIIDGFEFTDKLKSLPLYDTTKLCILSASIDPADLKKAKERGIPFIDKPLSIEKLKEIECL